MNEHRQLRRQLVATLVALPLLLTAACQNKTGGDKLPPKSGIISVAGNERQLAPAQTQIIGRVHAVDSVNGNVIVMLATLESATANNAGRQLVARDATSLKTTATLSPAQSVKGRMMGTRLISGAPKAGDEVVLLPAK